MNAYQIKQYGAHELLFLNEIAKPTLTPDKIMVKVSSASVNPVDYKIRSGAAKLVLHYQMPLTLGHDFSGVVTAVGEHITRFKVGDRVYERTPSTGSFQEYVLVNDIDIAKIPSRLSLTEAAAVPLVGLTAYQGLFDWIQLQENQSLLILGGSGGVGHVAVQLALLKKAKVYTTVSPEGITFLKDFGDITFINYHTEHFYDKVTEVNAVFDLRGGTELKQAYTIVKPHGSIASIATLPTPSYARRAGFGKPLQFLLAFLTLKARLKAKKRGISYNAFLTQSNSAELEQLSTAIQNGALTVKIQAIYTDREINQAIEDVKNGHVKGKIVVNFDW